MPQPPKNDLQTLQDTPEVAAAKTNHLSELRKANWQDQNLLSYKIAPSYFSFAQVQQEENSKREADLNLNTRETEASYSFSDISIEVCLDKRNVAVKKRSVFLKSSNGKFVALLYPSLCIKQKLLNWNLII